MGKKINSGDRKMLGKRDKRFGENRSQLLDPEGFEMPTPMENEKSKKTSGHVNEILKYLKHAVNAGDLVGLVNGETSEESLINVYMKILEKINLVLLKANDFLRNQNFDTQQLETQKVLFCNTNFIRELTNCAPEDYDALMAGADTTQKKRYEKIIKDITENDIVLIPYYPERTSASDMQQTPMLVELCYKKLQATLYMKAGDRITQTTMGGDTPTPTEQTGKSMSKMKPPNF